mgnify:CR=1 FL=1
MKYYSQKERLEIIIDIVKKLKEYKMANGNTINLYNNNFCNFISEFKKISNLYIKQEVNDLKEFKGTLYFEEIDKNIEYILPIDTSKKPLFVIRFK